MQKRQHIGAAALFNVSKVAVLALNGLFLVPGALLAGCTSNADNSKTSDNGQTKVNAGDNAAPGSAAARASAPANPTPSSNTGIHRGKFIARAKQPVGAVQLRV